MNHLLVGFVIRNAERKTPKWLMKGNIQVKGPMIVIIVENGSTNRVSKIYTINQLVETHFQEAHENKCDECSELS